MEGMEKPKLGTKRARKPDTAQRPGPAATTRSSSGGQGVHREVESEGVCGEVPGRNRWGATPKMNRSAKGGNPRSSLQYGGEGVLISPTAPKVFAGWHGTEEQCVTSGRTDRVSGWHRGKQSL